MNAKKKSESETRATFKLWGFEATGVSGLLVGALLIFGSVVYVGSLLWSLIFNTQVSLSPGRLGPYVIEQPIPDTQEIVPTVVENAFHFTDGKALLLSEDAAFCALTLVDDDSPAGYCEVLHFEGKWYIKTGGDGGANACKATCLVL